MHDGHLPRLTTSTRRSGSDFGLAEEFARDRIFGLSRMKRQSLEQTLIKEFDDPIAVLVALKNGKINECQAQATLRNEMGVAPDVAEKLVSSVLLGNLITTLETNSRQ